MAGGVRVVQPDPSFDTPHRTPEIDTVVVQVEGEERDRQRIIVHAAGAVLWDEVLGVGPGLVESVVSLTVPELRLLHGFAVTGSGDGRFRLLLNGSPVLSGRIDNINRSIERSFPTGVQMAPGDVVLLEVRCDSTVACDYEGSVFMETLDG